MRKLWIILVNICLLNNFVIGQDLSDSTKNIFSWKFYEYLIQSKLHDEAFTWLQKYPANLRNEVVDNTIYLEMSKLYSQKGEYQLSNNSLRKISAFTDTVNLRFAVCIAVMVSDTSILEDYEKRYSQLLTISERKKIATVIKSLKREKLEASDFLKDSTDNAFCSIAKNYLFHKKKSPALAGLLSAMVPGLGKLYIGYKYQAMSSFVMNISIIAIAAEYMCKGSGIIPWVIPLPVAVVFYSGNILGSILLTKKREIDFQNNTNENIKTYYSDKLLHIFP
jgi:hypothetical protein